MDVPIPLEQAAEFRAVMETDRFLRDERCYKDAVHLVIAACSHPRTWRERGQKLRAVAATTARPPGDAVVPLELTQRAASMNH